jgi:hypothetical protein
LSETAQVDISRLIEIPPPSPHLAKEGQFIIPKRRKNLVESSQSDLFSLNNQKESFNKLSQFS